jgi:mannose-6-phosphate isomerase-like protein (cupin superfamily)
MKYFVDLDNTLCKTIDGDYSNSEPIQDRINKVNELMEHCNHITIWTARGSRSGIDHRELTESQLNKWGIKYDELLMGKPDFDLMIDDKCVNVDTFWRIPNSTDNVSKKLVSEIVPKGWGKEIIFVNNDEYCGKILCFDKGKKFSMHYHIKKKETWYVAKGSFLLHWIEPESGTFHTEYLYVGDVITNERGEAHQVESLEPSEIFEVSTKHYDSDSYRIWKGN